MLRNARLSIMTLNVYAECLIPVRYAECRLSECCGVEPDWIRWISLNRSQFELGDNITKLFFLPRNKLECFAERKYFHVSLMFEGNFTVGVVYVSIEYSISIVANIRLGWKWPPRSNVLAYLAWVFMLEKKVLQHWHLASKHHETNLHITALISIKSLLLIIYMYVCMYVWMYVSLTLRSSSLRLLNYGL